MYDEMVWLGVAAFWLGAIFGSFANVIIVRLPAGENIALPASHCRKCKASIKWYDNIPIVSWLVLRGKCRRCSEKISARYPIVELVMGAVFAAITVYQGVSWTLIEYLVFAFMAITAAFIDIDHMILPNKLTLSGIVICLVGGLVNPEREFMTAFWGFLMGGGFLWLVAFLYQAIRGVEGMGGGDIKLLGWIGALLGWQSVPFVILVSSLFGSIIGIFVSLKSKNGLKATIPFGPYLVFAAIAYILGGKILAHWYLQLFFPWL